MGRMNLGPGLFWSDATQDAVDSILEDKYHVTEKFLDAVDAGNSTAIRKAHEIYLQAKKDTDAWEEFCEAAEDRYEDYKPKKKDFYYALATGLLLPDSPGPIALAMINKGTKKPKAQKKPKKSGAKK